VVVGYDFWKNKLDGAADAVGRVIRIRRHACHDRRRDAERRPSGRITHSERP
jgi:hypothetical protein